MSILVETLISRPEGFKWLPVLNMQPYNQHNFYHIPADPNEAVLIVQLSCEPNQGLISKIGPSGELLETIEVNSPEKGERPHCILLAPRRPRVLEEILEEDLYYGRFLYRFTYNPEAVKPEVSQLADTDHQYKPLYMLKSMVFWASQHFQYFPIL